ncbi:MAG: ANTAR domain-containing protein [Egibacteraceae bacterium]
MPDYPDDLWHSLADLSGLLLTEESLETTLRRVANLAVRTISGCDAVGVTLFEDGKLTTRAATGGLVYEVDNYQYDIDEGPCLQAVRDQRPYEIQNMDTEDRWPRFCKHAAERSIRSSLSLPLTVRGGTLGALNLYSRTPGALSAADRETALLFASQAAVALANAQTYAASVRLATQLGEALGSRAVIDQAKGVVMAHKHCDEDEAFQALRTASQISNRKLRDVARDIVTATISGTEPPVSGFFLDRSLSSSDGQTTSRIKDVTPPYA